MSLAIEAAAQALRDGELVAFPTETVYGLGADATNPAAVAQIYGAKGRPSHNPLIVHVAHLQQVAAFAVLPEAAALLAARHWPGPLTLVLRLQHPHPLAPAVTAGLGTVGVRIPAHPVARQLLERFGRPVAAPSANLSGRLSPTRSEHVDVEALVLEGGASEVGLESTILDATSWPPTLLRSGTLLATLEAELGPLPRGGDAGRPTSPGQLLRHYAPRTPVRLNARRCEPDEAWLGFGPAAAPPAVATRNLSATGDLAEAAANLFAMLHELDGCGATAIAVAPVPHEAEGIAINDRLQRAARG